MKNRIKKYCEQSGLPKSGEIQDYHRLQFLKEVERDLKYVRLEDADKNI